MPRRKITPEVWAKMCEAYVAWDPTQPGSVTIDELIRPFKISKQAFFTERARVGYPPLKASMRPERQADQDDGGVAAFLLAEVVDDRLRIKELERQIAVALAQIRELESRLTGQHGQ